MMLTFNDIKGQTYVDLFCAECNKIIEILGLHVIHKPMMTPESEYVPGSILPLTKKIRNLTALQKYKAMINAYDSLFIAIEYHSGNIEVQRKIGEPLSKTFLDGIFSRAIADSLISSLDIYSQFLGWFFDLKHRDTVGFSYSKLIVPLKSISIPLSEACNKMYNSPDFSYLKAIRDNEKHEGVGAGSTKIQIINKKITIEMKRAEELDLATLERATCNCLEQFYELLKITTSELSKWPTGYDSPRDVSAITDDEGFLKAHSGLSF